VAFALGTGFSCDHYRWQVVITLESNLIKLACFFYLIQPFLIVK
jgi:hypothetical protein